MLSDEKIDFAIVPSELRGIALIAESEICRGEAEVFRKKKRIQQGKRPFGGLTGAGFVQNDRPFVNREGAGGGLLDADFGKGEGTCLDKRVRSENAVAAIAECVIRIFGTAGITERKEIFGAIGEKKGKLFCPTVGAGEKGLRQRNGQPRIRDGQRQSAVGKAVGGEFPRERLPRSRM